MTDPCTADLVLVGAGHAHVQVLRRWMMAPMHGVRVTLVVDRPEAVYSGMVPGFVAGDYAAPELEIDSVPLARRAGVRIVLAPALRVDATKRRIEVEGRPSVAYDVASLDVGSTVFGLELPGVREHALATRPIRDFVDDLDGRLAGLREHDDPGVVIVGGGAAGAELAFTVNARLRARGVSARVTLVSAGHQLLEGYAPAVGSTLERELRARGIGVRLGSRVRAITSEQVELEDGVLAADRVIWAAGAAALPLARASQLPCDEAGFVHVDPTLQVRGHPELFAVGDCASLAWAPWVRKAGVFAVREGPVLDANLRAKLRGGALRPYRPQNDFLTLINFGDRVALGAKWGHVRTGRLVWRLKDWIDRRFMRRFQVLREDGRDARHFPTPEAMGMDEMACGGCAAKLGASPLARALERLPLPPPDASVRIGLGAPDDAAWLELPKGDSILASVDAFRSFVDDPWLVGRAAAVNAASDVLAKGGQPRHALALVTVTEEDPARGEEMLFQVLSGVRAALDPLGVALVGGHTTVGPELFVGLSITGDPPEAPLLLDGAREGDALVLTQPLGTGVLLAADMQGRAPGSWVVSTHRAIVRDNAAAARIAVEHGAHAATDVSGFGLAGHLTEMLRASGVAARLDLPALPALEGALALLDAGLRSTFHPQNREGHRGIAGSPGSSQSRFELLFDPQTCGGLLLCVAESEAESLVRALHAAGDLQAARIGEITAARPDGMVFEVSDAAASH
jgi:selenide,water dikinase